MFLHFWLLHPSFLLAAARAMYINLAVGQGQGVCQTTPVRHRPIQFLEVLINLECGRVPSISPKDYPEIEGLLEVMLTDWASANVCKSLHGRGLDL